jgi:hypothetical protein
MILETGHVINCCRNQSVKVVAYCLEMLDQSWVVDLPLEIDVEIWFRSSGDGAFIVTKHLGP